MLAVAGLAGGGERGRGEAAVAAFRTKPLLTNDRLRPSPSRPPAPARPRPRPRAWRWSKRFGIHATDAGRTCVAFHRPFDFRSFVVLREEGMHFRRQISQLGLMNEEGRGAESSRGVHPSASGDLLPARESWPKSNGCNPNGHKTRIGDGDGGGQSAAARPPNQTGHSALCQDWSEISGPFSPPPPPPLLRGGGGVQLWLWGLDGMRWDGAELPPHIG